MSTTSTLIDPARAKEELTAQILIVVILFHVLAFVIVTLRSYTRMIIVNSFGSQDVFMILSLLCSLLGGTVTLFMQVPHGLGHHMDTIPAADLIPFNQLSFVQSVVPLMGGIGFLKIAIALELMRLKGNALRWYNTILWGLIGFVTAYTFIAWFSFFLYCRPLAKYWDASIDGTCYSIDVFVDFSLANTSFNIFTDIAFATLPVGVVWTLNMPIKTRLYLVFVLSLGYLAVAMGIFKAVAQIHFDPTGDATYRYEIQFWGLLQLNIGIIAACAPSLKPLVKNVLRLGSLTPRSAYTDSARYNRKSSGRANTLLTIGGTGSRGYRKHNSQKHCQDNFELQPKYHSGLNSDGYEAHVEARDSIRSPGFYPKDAERGGSNGSEDTILRADTRKVSIVRTTEVSITY